MFAKGAWLFILLFALVTIATVRAGNDNGNSREDDKGKKPPGPPRPPPKPSPGKGSNHGRGDPHDHDGYGTVITVLIIVVVIFLLSLLSALLWRCCCYKPDTYGKPRDEGYRPIIVVTPHTPCYRGDQGGAPPTTHVALHGYGSFEAGPAPAVYNGGAGANLKHPTGTLPPYSQSAGCSNGNTQPTAPPPSSPPFSSGSKRFKV